MNKKRKVSFYKLSQDQHIRIDDGNTCNITALPNETIEANFNRIYQEHTTELMNGSKAITVHTLGNTYVVEIVSYEDHASFIKIGQQNSANTVALRDQNTLETEHVPMSATQQLELFTFCYIDFETGIVSYIGINGAPKISAIRSLFDNILIREEGVHTKLASIMTSDILQTLVRKNIISKLSITVAVPSDEILSDVIGLDATDFDTLRNVKTRTATYKLVASRNKNIFQSSSNLAELIAALKGKFGNNLKGLTANAKDSHEFSQEYDLLQYSFTKTVTLGGEEGDLVEQEDFEEVLIHAYNQNRAELVRYAAV